MTKQPDKRDTEKGWGGQRKESIDNHRLAGISVLLCPCFAFVYDGIRFVWFVDAKIMCLSLSLRLCVCVCVCVMCIISPKVKHRLIDWKSPTLYFLLFV